MSVTQAARVAVVAGATGLVGRQLVAELLADPLVAKVKALVRRLESFSPDPRLEEVLLPTGGTGFSGIKDFRDERYRGEVYYCCLGTTIRKAGSQKAFREVDYDAVVASAKLAEAHSARTFVVVSAMGANPSSTFFYNRVKGEGEQAVSALNIPRVVIFRPSFLVSERGRSERRIGEEAGLALVRAVGPWLPAAVRGRLETRVEVLVRAMVAEGIHRDAPGRFTIESADTPAHAIGFRSP